MLTHLLGGPGYSSLLRIVRKAVCITALLVVSSAGAQTPPVPDILWYEFNESGASLTNYASSPPAGATTATINGAMTQSNAYSATALSLAGTGISGATNYVDTGWSLSTNGDWTMSFFTSNIPAPTSINYVFGDPAVTSFRCFTGGVAGTGNWLLRGTGVTDVLVTGGADANQHMITFVYDSTNAQIRAYLDGTLNNTVAQGVIAFAGGSLHVGAYNTSPGLSGNMADFRFYNHALSATDISNIYNYILHSYYIGGAVSGLASTGLVLQNNGGDDLPIAADGNFTFVTPILDHTGYEVTVSTQPAGQNCTLSNDTGTVSGADITNVSVVCIGVIVAPASLPDSTVGAAYNQTIMAAGGTSPYAFAITSGSLPAGLTLASDGTLSGTPTAGGTFDFIVTATDFNSLQGQQAYELAVDAPTITLLPLVLPDATQNSTYSQPLAASGGTATYTYAVTSGSLPSGISLTTDGLLSGTPTGYGGYNFSVTATDSSTGTGPYAGTAAYTLKIAGATPVISPTALPAATVDGSYSQAITASSGNPAYTFSISAGTLPPGLSLDSGGLLSGTPTTAGTYPFTVEVIDAATSTATQSYSFSVQQASTIVNLSTACQTEFVENQPFTFNATMSGSATGTVDFYNESTSINMCPGVAVAAGSASCTVDNLAVQGSGTSSKFALIAKYNGDTNHLYSTSPELDVTVLSAADVVFRAGFDAESLNCPIE
jgi:hypothetical protein